MKHKSPHILVVDDESDLCWALEEALRPAGYIVTSVNDGQEALQCIAQQSYAVAFIDAKIPNGDGLTLASHIRKQSPNTSIVLISGYYYQEDKAINEGLQKNLFSAFIAKPFDLNEVRMLARQSVIQNSKAKKCQKHPS
jgi:CheY-like chemotaxis protein